jgi:hypothetical protein
MHRTRIESLLRLPAPCPASILFTVDMAHTYPEAYTYSYVLTRDNTSYLRLYLLGIIDMDPLRDSLLSAHGGENTDRWLLSGITGHSSCTS